MESYDEETHFWIQNPDFPASFKHLFTRLRNKQSAIIQARLWRPDILWLLSVLQAVQRNLDLKKGTSIHDSIGPVFQSLNLEGKKMSCFKLEQLLFV